MLPCMILGDSIAVGVSMERRECVSHAKVGITSAEFVATHGKFPQAKHVVISLGVNDSDAVPTKTHLETLRRSIPAGSQVTWYLPGSHPHARDAVAAVARAHRDRIVDLAPLVGPDKVHPARAEYQKLAADIPAGAMARDTAPKSPYRSFASTADIYRAFPVRPPPPPIKARIPPGSPILVR